MREPAKMFCISMPSDVYERLHDIAWAERESLFALGLAALESEVRRRERANGGPFPPAPADWSMHGPPRYAKLTAGAGTGRAFIAVKEALRERLRACAYAAGVAVSVVANAAVETEVEKREKAHGGRYSPRPVKHLRRGRRAS